MSELVSIDQTVLDNVVRLARERGDDPSHFLAQLVAAEEASPRREAPIAEEQPASEPASE